MHKTKSRRELSSVVLTGRVAKLRFFHRVNLYRVIFSSVEHPNICIRLKTGNPRLVRHKRPFIVVPLIVTIYMCEN